VELEEGYDAMTGKLDECEALYSLDSSDVMMSILKEKRALLFVCSQ
jgi:hypothetical protein